MHPTRKDYSSLWKATAVSSLVGPDEMVEGWAGLDTFPEITRALR